MIGRRSLLAFIIMLVSAILAFIGLFLITNYLGAAVYGSIAFAYSLLATFNAFTDLGFNQAHIKKVSEGQEINECISTFIVIKLALTGVFVTVSLVSVFIWTEFLGGSLEGETGDLVVLFTLYYVLYNFSSIVTYTYYGKLQIAKAQVVALADPLVRIPLIAIVAFGGGSAIQIAYAYVAAGLSIFIVASLFLLRDGIKWKGPVLYRQYLKFAFPLALVTVIGTFTINIDKIMLGYYDSSEAVAYYSSSQTFLSVFTMVGVAMASLTYPYFSKWHTQGKIAEIRKTSLIAERYLSMFTMPIITLIVLFPTEIAVALFGDQFASAGESMRWLAVGTLFTLINAVHTSQINAVNRPDLTAKLIFLQFLVFIPLLIILVPSTFFGLTFFGLSYLGAAIASMITSLVVFLATRWIVLGLTNTRTNPRLAIYLLCTVITGGALFIIEKYLPIDNWVIFLLYILMALGIFAALLYALRELTKTDIRYFMDTFSIRKMWRYSFDELSGRTEK